MNLHIICNFSRNKILLFREVQWGLKDVWKYNGNLICMDNIPVFHLPHQSIYFHDGIILLLSLSWLLKGSSVEQKRRATFKSFQLYNYHVHNYERTSHYQDINIVRSTL